MVKNTSESGRSMVEMLGVIAIIGVIAVGGITSMSYIDSYFRTSSTLLEIDQMASDIVDLCSWSTDGYEACLGNEGNATQLICSEKVLRCPDKNGGVNRWGGKITVAPNGDSNFKIVFTEVPSSVCAQMSEELNDDARNHLVYVSCGDGDDVTAIFSLK